MTAPDERPASEQCRFEARAAELPHIAGFARAFCALRGVGHDDALRVTLVLEELFANTVRHGHGGDSAAPVRIALTLAGRSIEIRYEDSAPRHDPLNAGSSQRDDLDAPVEERRVGGLGVHLVDGMVDSARYSYADGRNRLRLLLGIDPPRMSE
jgi:anti-sigma regulatory factor (Ser/Thr protein kinase)